MLLDIKRVYIALIILAISNVINTLPSFHYSSSAYRQKHILGPEGKYTLEWKVNWLDKSVTFNVSADCKGYIGLGLSKSGSMADSDFFIGGIDSSGKPYFTDMHGVANGTLQEDYKNDWTFLGAHRAEGRLHLGFSRLFETCDTEDYQISSDLVHVIWAYGDTDEITLFSPHHGNESFYLLDPDQSSEIANSVYQQIGPHSNLYLMQRWSAVTKHRIPPHVSSQMCSIIKGLRLNAQHFIRGGGSHLPFEKTKSHVRQILLSRCVPPEGRDAAISFDSLVAKDGQECNSFQNSSLIPKHLCTETIFVSGVGTKPFYFPEGMGVPIGLSPDEYYLLEIHYHNPEKVEDLTIKVGLDLMIHPRPVKYEVGIQTVSYGLYGLFTIPPRSLAFSIYGHCSSQCTKDLFPNEGFDVVAVMFRMRSKGTIIRLRHFRGTTELPWILHDDNYDGSYQQVRLLSKFVGVLPGDQLTLQCTYDTLSKPNTTFSGFSTDQEECAAYLYVNKRVTSAWCSSEYSIDNQLPYLGLKSISRNISHGSVSSQKGEDFLEYATKNARWSPSARAALQREMLHGLQITSCPTHTQVARSGRARRYSILANRTKKGQNETSSGFSFSTPFSTGIATIPNISQEYRPSSECQRNIIPVNNFGYHRNIKTGRLKSNVVSQNSANVNLSTGQEDGNKQEQKTMIRRFRRINLG